MVRLSTLDLAGSGRYILGWLFDRRAIRGNARNMDRLPLMEPDVVIRTNVRGNTHTMVVLRHEVFTIHDIEIQCSMSPFDGAQQGLKGRTLRWIWSQHLLK